MSLGGPAEHLPRRWSRRTSNKRARNATASRRPLATDSGKEMGYKGYDPGFGGDTAAFNELVDSVDFPKFVADLLKAVFDANLKVMKQQTDTYIKLMKEATKSTRRLHQEGQGRRVLRQARRVAAATSTTSSPRRQPDGTHEAGAHQPRGRQGRHRGRRGQAAHPRSQDQHGQGAPRRAARGAAHGRHAPRREQGRDRGRRRVQHQGDAREQGAPRGPEHQRRQRRTWTTSRRSSASSAARAAASDVTNTNIQVNTSDKKATDDLSATLKGKVKIEFKTDYFKLDNFATMYADGGVAGAEAAPRAGARRRRRRQP